MPILSEPDVDRREAYKKLDRILAEKREFYRSQAEHYPILEDVIRGRATFGARALVFEYEFGKTFNSVISILQYSGFPKWPFSIPYTDGLIPFGDMLSDLTGEQVAPSVDYKQLLGNILTGRTSLYSQTTLDQLKHFFLGLISSAFVLDKSVRRSFLDVLVQENPDVFKEEYCRMKPEEREYAEYTLSRMLGAGMLEMDEIKLESIVRDAREQAGRDDDGAE